MQMATNVVFIHDLPFQPRRNLCRILDADRRWEELGGSFMNYDVTTLTLIGQAILRDKSPTWELLNKYSEKNGTIKHLYRMLAEMDHHRALSILKPYVDSKYHFLCKDDDMMSTISFTYSQKEDPHRITSSHLSTSSSRARSSMHTHSTRHEKASCDTSKFQQNFVNLNKESSSVSMHSKMNSLNASKTQQKDTVNKLPNLSILKINSDPFQESSSDNCISAKMTGVKKFAKKEALQHGKPQKPSSPFAGAMPTSLQDDCLPDIMRIPYKDIRCATDDFNSERVLGKGGFGIVYRGEWKGISVAIKKLTPRHRTYDPSQQLVSIKQSLNELNILKTCRFDYILPLYAVSLDGEHPCLIYQLMVNGSLEDRLFLKYKTAPLTWSQRSHIAECTTKGLNYLHTTPGKPLVHGDIKSANILLDANMDAKIGDFGLTREGPGCQDTHVKVSSIHGTECYLPDEYLRHKHLSPQVDIYSYGIVLLEIATGLRPFDPKRGKGQRLTEHVALCVETGRLESLRDTKAGEENMIWFRELIRIGQICSSLEKKKRPPMNEMLVQFEKIKQEMSMMDKIRRLSNDKGSSQLPSGLSPIEIQLYYDLQKTGQSRTSPKNQLSISPGRELNLLSEDPQAGSLPSEPGEKSPEPLSSSTLENGACGGLESHSPDPAQDGVQVETSADKASSAKIPFPDAKAPLPLLSILQLQVSEIDDTSADISSQIGNSESSTNDYLTDE